jgi:VWFA-related protein
MSSKRFRLALFGWAVLWISLPTGARAQYADQESTSRDNQQAPATTLPESGPSKGVGETVVVPRPRAPQPPPPPKPRPLDPDNAPVFRTDVELVNVSVVVQDKNGNFLPGLKKENFRLSEDGVPQTLQRVEAAEAPMTVVMVIEYSSLYWEFLYDTMNAAYGFVNSLEPQDWVAVMVYDLRTEVLLDFTRNKQAAFNAISVLRTPGFSESNLFDAVSEAVERMQDIDGKKAIVLISSGVDTFSKTRYDAVLKKVQASDTPIYAIGTGQAARLWYEGRGYMGSEAGIGFLQADNQLRTFARYSGGRAYFPRFEGEFPSIFADISAALRNEYVLSYSPTNAARDGKFRKIKVELLDAAGKPLKITDPKGKEIKYEIRAREGYTAPRAVE